MVSPPLFRGGYPVAIVVLWRIHSVWPDTRAGAREPVLFPDCVFCRV